MKARTRLISIVLSVFLLLLLCLFSNSLHVRYKKAAGTLPQRIVIFGDESSSISSPADLRRRDVMPSTWASAFCQRLHTSCDSFAPIKPTQGYVGSVTDNIVSNTTSPDFRDQVDSWIDFETKVRKSGIDAERSTLYVVSFGTNDVWQFSSLSRQDGISAVEASLDSMFEQLDRIAQHWSDPPQVLIPTAIDVTMLPAWAKYRRDKDITGQEIRNAVFLSKKWNQQLELRAAKWREGTVILFDAGQWFMDTLRSGRSGGWKDVRDACLADGGSPCKDPGSYLMWDGLHLGPRAQEKMAYDLIRYLM